MQLTDAIPNFVVIGAAKAGTTSLHGWLSQHPQVFVPGQKELHFFAEPWLRENCRGPGDERKLQHLAADWHDYLAHYRDAGGYTAIGDVSPSYFSWWPSRDAIRQRLGEPRILLLLRDPVGKAFSQYTHLLRDGREKLSFWEGLQAEPDRIARGYGAIWRYLGGASYAEPTERFLETFGRDRMKILFFEDLISRPHDVLRETFEFLGVAPDVRINTSDVRNRSGAPKSRWIAGTLNNPSLRRMARAVLPAAFVARVGARATELNAGAKPVLDEQSREFIRERIAPDLRRLARLLDRKPVWLD